MDSKLCTSHHPEGPSELPVRILVMCKKERQAVSQPTQGIPEPYSLQVPSSGRRVNKDIPAPFQPHPKGLYRQTCSIVSQRRGQLFLCFLGHPFPIVSKQILLHWLQCIQGTCPAQLLCPNIPKLSPLNQHNTTSMCPKLSPELSKLQAES